MPHRAVRCIRILFQCADLLVYADGGLLPPAGSHPASLTARPSRQTRNDASDATPLIFRSDAVVCRRACTRMLRMPLSWHSRVNERTRLRGSTGRPVLVVKIRPVSAQLAPRLARSAACC
jgi:hypothetical protein